MKVDIEEFETADYDILENIKVAFYRLWKMKLIVILMTMVGVLFFFIYLGIVGVHTTYLSTASIYSAMYGSYEESTYGVTVMNQYSSMLGSTKVCERAAGSLQGYGITAPMLRSMVTSGDIYLSGASMDSKSYGTKLTLVVKMNESEHVVEIANTMAKAFADEINDLLGVSSLQVMDEATEYASYKSINVLLYFLLFGALAFVGTAGIIFIKEFFSSIVYSVSQCEQNEELVLGLIPYKSKEGKEL